MNKTTNIAKIYNNIARDFSRTRRKVWKSVETFINSFEQNTLNADIGCGNGKNMLHRNDIMFKGIDIYDEFVKICKSRNLDVINGNILNILFLTEFDNVIPIAVIHHIENRLDRLCAIKELYRICKTGGKIMIYAWA